VVISPLILELRRAHPVRMAASLSIRDLLMALSELAAPSALRVPPALCAFSAFVKLIGALRSGPLAGPAFHPVFTGMSGSNCVGLLLKRGIGSVVFRYRCWRQSESSGVSSGGVSGRPLSLWEGTGSNRRMLREGGKPMRILAKSGMGNLVTTR